MMTQNSPFLVLGAAVNFNTALVDFTPEVMSVFVHSFRKHMNCDIVLFTGNLAESTMAWLHAAGVRTIAVSPDRMPHNYRFLAARAFLDKHPGYSHIFLTDVRDVLAQGDIFEALKERPGMHIFLESEGLTLGECAYNSGWLLQGYGREVLTAYKDKPISCVGTLFGDRLSMLCYLSAVSMQLCVACPAGSARLDLFGMDTAAHLHLFHSGEISGHLKRLGKELVVHQNGEFVLTIGRCKEFYMTEDNRLGLCSRSLPEVVHQYDRFSRVTEVVQAIYPA